ncbi:MAG: phospholipase A [Sulfuricella denitrificans]|nr:phospholipase A [Sulfuricella denitrificans]
MLLLSGMLPLLATGADYEKCAVIVPDIERLACYDQTAAQAIKASPALAGPSQKISGQRPETLAETDSFIGRRWELDKASKKGTFRFREYKPVYILPFHYSNNPNQSPASPAPDHSIISSMPVGNTDVKYQLSFKTKLWEDALGDNGDLWFAYTQQSHWLLYNPQVSSPFRETNYEPELIFTLRTDVDLPGEMRWRMLNLGLSHQSNGRGLPLSRSWNRVYAQLGFERENFTIFLRPWLRLPESSEKDDNPDITRYMGNGDVLLNYRSGENTYSALGHVSPSTGHGALQLSWGFPISKTLKGYVQAFSGYGESLIDYNHKQTSLGIGFSLQEWR